AQMPVLYPGNVQEVIEYGRYGIELSRYCGSWVGFKIVTNVADAYGTARVWPIDNIVRPQFEFNGKPWQPIQNNALLAPYVLDQEREMHEGRMEAAQLFAAANGLNRITVKSDSDRLGLIATGKTYYDLREALHQLGLTDEKLNEYGIRLLKIGMIYPMEPTIVYEFVDGLEEVFVIEEKRGFMEMLIRDVLYNHSYRPKIVGKRDEQNRYLVPGHAELDPDQIIKLLRQRLHGFVPDGMIADTSLALKLPINLSLSPATTRTAYFCSGCPHNRSTVVPEGSIAAAGIGCHTLAMLMDRDTAGLTHMGGEGAQWVGASYFTETEHLFQNIGDGTLFHSGYLAIRQAIAANTNITYKVLYNAAVAMTGGQSADGQMTVPNLTHGLTAEGVKKIIVVTDDPEKYPASTKWADDVDIMHRDDIMDAQKTLRDIKGVTVMIYDQPCAADLRRKRKRGKAKIKPMRIMINEAVCEGCGDCGRKSNCLSVFPTQTEYGRKTQIHQSSCNLDYSCLGGDCPAFVSVTPQRAVKQKAPHRPSPTKLLEQIGNLPEPHQLPAKAGNVYMVGIGGTGVVTINQILGAAAMIDGKYAYSLDQTGLSQKGGQVASHLKVLPRERDVAGTISERDADTYILFDLLGGTAEKNLKLADPNKTIAIVSSSEIPTGAMVRNTAVAYPTHNMMQQRLEQVTQKEKNVYLDAIGVSEKLFGNHMPGNIMTIGAAYQAGGMPITALAIERAIKLNGVAVESNLAAFRMGRLLVADEAKAAAIINPPEETVQESPKALSPTAQKLVDPVNATGELLRLLKIRVPELIAYQNESYAQHYLDYVNKVAQVDEYGRLSEAVARYLFKLMAYKDEYEVARLYLKPEFEAQLQAQFGADAKVQYKLHPPFLRSMGMNKKLTLGRWFKPFFQLLAAMRSLRGGSLDFFGYTTHRQMERSLIDEYKTMIDAELANLTPERYETAVQLAELPDMIRGYDEVKEKNVAAFRTAVADLQQTSSRIQI
ncbi:MAG: indolepyruvate ferredoxin oxidoreductase family protein, partial [Chloroflexota bacterium]